MWMWHILFALVASEQIGDLAVRNVLLKYKACTTRLLCQPAIQLLSDGPIPCGQSTEQWALLMVQIAGNYYKLGDYAEVELYASKAKCALEADGLTKCYAFAESLNSLAVCFSHKGDFADAENVSRTALSVYRCCVSKDHPAIGTELSNLGGYCSDQSKFEEAESFLQQALQVELSSLPA
jgi:uncharacterized protein HemY